MTVPKMTVLSIQPDTNQWTLHLSSSALKKIGKNSATVCLGAEGIKKRVSLSPLAPSSTSIVSKVRLSNRSGSLVAGPIIGILTVKRGAGFKGNKKNYIDIIQTAKSLGAIVYVFNVEDIDWSTRTTGAYFYQESSSTWNYLAQTPLPQVVYNRIPYREDEEKGYVQSAIRQLISMPTLHLFNHHFFNKWDLYDKLSHNPRVAHYIPESRKLRSFKDLSQMISNHPLLYLKPISGKAGKGIMTIQRSSSHYVLKQRVGNQLAASSFHSEMDLWNQIKKKVHIGYVIQQGIPLATFDGRSFDIRVLVQKDGKGVWGLSGVGIRVAGKNSITTHVPRGGSIALPENVFRSYMSESDYEALMIRLEKTVLELADALEGSYRNLGEFSMDIGINRTGQLWFFEANAKPMKFDEPHIRKISLERIIQYSLYLASLNAKGDESVASETSNS